MQNFSHLTELRRRIGWSLVIWLSVLAPLLYFSNIVYHWFALPLIKLLPANGHLVTTNITSSFTTPFQLTCMLSLWIIMPFLLYQIWAFIAPALYPKERRLFLPLVSASILLFYLGLLFAYFVVCPMALQFFIYLTPTGVTVMTDIQNYLDFVLSLLFAFGIAFQGPIITWVLLSTGVVTVDQLQKSRPYIIVLAFILGMLLTPPDVVSQILLALPLWGLFELSIYLFIMSKR
jgi:sec-independent protein translocase protein TatC